LRAPTLDGTDWLHVLFNVSLPAFLTSVGGEPLKIGSSVQMGIEDKTTPEVRRPVDGQASTGASRGFLT
jgi:hypothetical protein